MSDEAALRAAVVANPDDPLPRLIYADYLDDQGDPRSELLRLDVELTARADDDPTAEPLRQRLAELMPGIDPRWRADVCRVPVEFGEPFINPRRDARNAPGPWYTCGDCQACGHPQREAPTLLLPLRYGNQSTYFDFQPRSPTEVRAACAAAKACCNADLRYGGTDPVVIQMLGNDPRYCDHVIPPGEAKLVRVDPQPDPRGLAYVEAAYQRLYPEQRSPLGRKLDRLADFINYITLGLLGTFTACCLFVLLVYVVLTLFGMR